jgi:hypothetical protein
MAAAGPSLPLLTDPRSPRLSLSLYYIYKSQPLSELSPSPHSSSLSLFLPCRSSDRPPSPDHPPPRCPRLRPCLPNRVVPQPGRAHVLVAVRHRRPPSVRRLVPMHDPRARWKRTQIFIKIFKSHV